MSKVDAQRAMREARYARNRAGAVSHREAAGVGGSATAPAARPPEGKPDRAADVAAPEGERCGHTSMNGRACTREAAHPQKSHRYS
jgi:hypothetical protein